MALGGGVGLQLCVLWLWDLAVGGGCGCGSVLSRYLDKNDNLQVMQLKLVKFRAICWE